MDSIKLNSDIKLSEKFSDVNKGIEVKENDYALIQELFPQSEEISKINSIFKEAFPNNQFSKEGIENMNKVILSNKKV